MQTIQNWQNVCTLIHISQLTVSWNERYQKGNGNEGAFFKGQQSKNHLQKYQ